MRNARLSGGWPGIEMYIPCPQESKNNCERSRKFFERSWGIYLGHVRKEVASMRALSINRTRRKYRTCLGSRIDSLVRLVRTKKVDGTVEVVQHSSLTVHNQQAKQQMIQAICISSPYRRMEGVGQDTYGLGLFTTSCRLCGLERFIRVHQCMFCIDAKKGFQYAFVLSLGVASMLYIVLRHRKQ